MKIPIDSIKTSDKNPRKITEENFEKLKADMKADPKFLEVRPILVDGRTMEIYAGNQRWRAAKALGWTEVSAEIDTEPEEIQRKRGLTDNLHRGEFDYDILANEYEVDELKDAGFTDKDLGNLKLDAEEDDFDVVIPETPISKLGDIYELGDHRLMCGDSTKKEDVEKLMDGEKADMVFTDPPYGMNLDTDYESMSAKSTKVKGIKYSKVIGDDEDFNPMPLISMFPEARNQLWWGADYFYDKLPSGGSWIIWVKRNENMTDIIGNHFEVCWSMEKHKRQVIYKAWSGVTARNPEFTREHPTEKPISLNARLISESTKNEDVIVDLFGGSGSTLIACEQTKRKCRMMELDPKYCDVIVKRFIDLTGKDAVRLSDGKKWSEI